MLKRLRSIGKSDRLSKEYSTSSACCHLKTIKTGQDYVASFLCPASDQSSDVVSPDGDGDGLTSSTWGKMLEDEGGLLRLQQHIYRGGAVHPEVREEVWMYLLEVYPFGISKEEKKQRQQQIQNEYDQLLEKSRSLVKLHTEMISLHQYFVEKRRLSDDDVFTDDVMNDTDSGILEDVEYRRDEYDESMKDGIGSIREENSQDMSEDDLCNGTDEVIELKVIKTEDSQNNEITSGKIEHQISVDSGMSDEDASLTMREDIIQYILGVTQLERLNEKFVVQSECFTLGIACDHCCGDAVEIYDTYEECTQAVFDHRHSPISPAKRNAKRRREEEYLQYAAWLSTYKSHSAINENRRRRSSDACCCPYTNLTRLRQSFTQLDLDVERCDLLDLEKNRDKLRNVVQCYVLENQEYGYAQGMCDLCAPLVHLFDDEADIYACFCKLMARMIRYFPRGNQTKDMEFLTNWLSLVHLLDPELYDFLSSRCEDGSNFVFVTFLARTVCYEWFLLNFKRAFSHRDIFEAWEVMFAAYDNVSSHFDLFVGFALLETYREDIMKVRDIGALKNLILDRRGKHDVKQVLELARQVVNKLRGSF